MEEATPKVIYAQHDNDHGTLKRYITGFVLSVLLTMGAFVLVYPHAHSGATSYGQTVLILAVMALAFVQFLIQLFFFLHLGGENKPRWRLFVLFFMVLIVLIIVVGSLWIMHNMNYRMTPSQINTYMQQQDGGL